MVRTEIIRQEFAARLNEALNNANYPPHGRGVMLAQRMGVTSKAVSKWLTGESLPRAAMMKNIAKALNVDPLWLQHGDEARAREQRLLNTLIRNRHPLISWEDADNWKAYIKENFHRLRYFFSGSVMEHGEAFWLMVKDDSMTSSVGMCVPQGSHILIDPTYTADNGHFVLAKLEAAKEATFKQYIVDEGTNKRYLKPLNNSYKPIEIDDACTLIGVVVESRMNLVTPDPSEDISLHYDADE
ncbi:LexA family protein [Pantoea dispersa]|uniref:LexA family protein n=1 Tax=Pantoea dispersa TaxID=59814 RepID=UPI002858E422|nr:S24 family peptidase [Pantoea dispersa]MDR6295002.1 SOS-response transcriptional repressor LexA [Pantoea dispersa]